MQPFHRSELTDRLVRYLRELPKETSVTYAELSRSVGETITSKSGHLASAKAILLRDHNQIWKAVAPRVGIVRLNDVQLADRLRNWHLAGARRKIIRGGREAEHVDSSQLDIDTQARFATDCIQRELVAQSLSKATKQRLERVARGTSNDLPSFNAIEWAITLSPRRPQP